jgi:phosphohistidine phosphatase
VTPQSRPRRLWLIRHARAADAKPDQEDYDRPLTRKGERQCGALADWLKTRTGIEDAKALVSPAVRTRETADRVLDAWFGGPRVPEPRIWNASTTELTELLQENTSELMIIGHNPGLEQLQSLLSGQLMPMPTAGAFELAFDDKGRCFLEATFQPPNDSM